jgi:hypothetical protein
VKLSDKEETMSYVKHNWVNGEVLVASLMNHIEDELEELDQNSNEMATDADCDALFDDFLED